MVNVLSVLAGVGIHSVALVVSEQKRRSLSSKTEGESQDFAWEIRYVGTFQMPGGDKPRFKAHQLQVIRVNYLADLGLVYY